MLLKIERHGFILSSVFFCPLCLCTHSARCDIKEPLIKLYFSVL